MLLIVIVLLASIGAIIFALTFYQLVMQAAQAIIIMSCRMDHGHFGNHWVPCNCKCHQMPHPERPGAIIDSVGDQVSRP